ncbi:MAG: DUF4139 domain-containing protein [Ahrensia sp.]|nr:DUF4139 domain-containing protein [Ahrensia sp.]
MRAPISAIFSAKSQICREKISQLAPVEELRSVVAINLNVANPSDAKFKIKYAVDQAGWQAIYDAKLELGDGSKPSMDIVRRANVTQSTSENWEGVALTLSTARPSTSTFAPELPPFEIIQLEPVARSAQKLQSLESRVRSESLQDYAVSAEPAAAPEIRQEVATMDVGGFQATYQIPGKVTVENTNQVKSVVMGEETLDVAMSAYTVPSSRSGCVSYR